MFLRIDNKYSKIKLICMNLDLTLIYFKFAHFRNTNLTFILVVKLNLNYFYSDGNTLADFTEDILFPFLLSYQWLLSNAQEFFILCFILPCNVAYPFQDAVYENSKVCNDTFLVPQTFMRKFCIWV